MEIWKDIKGFENIYQISNMGRVKSLARTVPFGNKRLFVKEKIKYGSRKNNGYISVILYINNKPYNKYIHRLVAEAFISNLKNKDTINHKDGNKSNNSVENLEWATYSENNIHAVKTGLRKPKNNKSSFPVEQRTFDGKEIIQVFPSMREAERQTGIDVTAIGRGIKNGWKSGGYTWALA